MPTDLPLVNFLRKSATNGFTLLETMLSLAVLGILLVLAVPDFFPMLQRQRFKTRHQKSGLCLRRLNLWR